MIAQQVGAAPGQQDSVGCLLIIAGYDDISPALRLVTEQAVSHINASPELGDFFELRLVGLGGRPAPDASREKAVARLAAALTQPKRSVGRYYFALVIADRSASLVARLLEECAKHPVIAQLPIRYRGLASVEDRLPGSEQPEQGGEDDPDGILVAPTGIWHQAELVHEVQQFTRELLQDFASAPEAGLTSAQLGQLRPDAGDDTAERASLQPPLDELTPMPADRVPQHDLPALPSESTDVVPLHNPPALPSESTDVVPLRRELAPSMSPALQSPARGLPGIRHPGRVRHLWRPARRAARVARDSEQAHSRDRQPRPARLVFLALVGDECMYDLANWRRGRSVLLEIDDKLAAADPVGYQVRALRRAGDEGMTELREPGRLARRDIGRPAAILDFPRVLNLVRSAVKRQNMPHEPDGAAVPRATVVFFAAAAPLADAVTTGIYRQLAGEAAVTWIVPERLSDLLSGRFEERGVRKIPDHPAVADEVVSHLSDGENRDEDE